MCSLPGYNQVANARTRARRNVTNWTNYASKIAIAAEKNSEALQDKANFHLCMIIGYNEETNEIAISDSWGKNYSVRWIHVHEAEAVSNKGGYVIDI